MFLELLQETQKSIEKKKTKETNVSKLGSEIGVTEDDIPGVKVQMNDNFVSSNSPRRLYETKLGPGYHSFLKWRKKRVHFILHEIF